MSQSGSKHYGETVPPFHHQEVSQGPFLSALPITFIETPTVRLPPRLAYSTNVGSRSPPYDAQKKPGKLPTRKSRYHSPYNEAEIRAFAASCHKYKHNLINVPEAGLRKVKKFGLTKSSEQERAISLDQRFRALHKRGKTDPFEDAKLLLGLNNANRDLPLIISIAF